MSAWFQQHGLPIEQICANAAAAGLKERIANTTNRLPCTPASVADAAAAAVANAAAAAKAVAAAAAAAPAVSAGAQQQQQQRSSQEVEVVPEGPDVSEWLLLSDFDKTLTDMDAGARSFAVGPCPS